ncbi:MAG TPA: PadR family transcriptional regulator [Actinomycetes bacterium]
MTRRRSNPLALAVLACLIERPMHPYEISTTLRERGKEQSIKLNYGSLYSVVESLQKHGLIVAQDTQRAGRRPERTTYAVTPAGVDEFEDWLAELLSTPVKEYPALEAALSLLPGLAPDEAARLLELRVTKLDLELSSLEAMHAMADRMALPQLLRVESDYRVAMVVAERDFVRRLASDIRSGSLGGTAFWRRMYELRDQGVSTEEMFAKPREYFDEEVAAWLAPKDHTGAEPS